MSSEHSELVRFAATADPSHLRRVFSEAVRVVVEQQFVEISPCDRSIYRVDIGSGMGLESSDQFSSFCFHSLVESKFTSSFRAEHKIVAYYRFKDDVLLVTKFEV